MKNNKNIVILIVLIAFAPVIFVAGQPIISSVQESFKQEPDTTDDTNELVPTAPDYNDSKTIRDSSNQELEKQDTSSLQQQSIIETKPADAETSKEDISDNIDEKPNISNQKLSGFINTPKGTPLSISATLSLDNDFISGSYFYTSIKESIYLSGNVTSGDKIVMYERVDGKNTGKFEGVVSFKNSTKIEIIEGKFTNLSTGKKTDFVWR